MYCLNVTPYGAAPCLLINYTEFYLKNPVSIRPYSCFEQVCEWSRDYIGLIRSGGLRLFICSKGSAALQNRHIPRLMPLVCIGLKN